MASGCLEQDGNEDLNGAVGRGWQSRWRDFQAGVRQQFDSLELLMSRHLPEAELYKLNLAAPSRSGQGITAFLFGVIQKALEFSSSAWERSTLRLLLLDGTMISGRSCNLMRPHSCAFAWNRISAYFTVSLSTEIRFTHPGTTIDLGDRQRFCT